MQHNSFSGLGVSHYKEEHRHPISSVRYYKSSDFTSIMRRKEEENNKYKILFADRDGEVR